MFFVVADDWDRPYSKEQTFFPLKELLEDNYWPPVGRIDNLAGYLKELNKAGVISTADPVASARQFFALLRGDLYMRRLLDLAPEPAAEEVAAVAGEAVMGFLAIHAPG